MVATQRKEARVEEYGDVDKIVVKDVDIPPYGDDQVLVKVDYAGVNFVDTYIRSGGSPGGVHNPGPLPKALGSELAGTIEAVGKNVTHLHVGDRVAALSTSGAYATYAITNADRTVKLPHNVSTKQGAAVLLQGLTVLPMITEDYTVKQGDFAVVHSAAGGVGQLLVQALKVKGAIVIALASTEEKLNIAKNLGADHTVLNTGDWSKEVLKFTERDGENGAHVIFDPVGKATWEGSLQSTRRKGSLISFGTASGAIEPFGVGVLAPRGIHLSRFMMYTYVQKSEEFAHYAQELFSLVGEKKLSVAYNNDDGYPLTKEGVAQAHQDIVSRKTTGKLLINTNKI